MKSSFATFRSSPSLLPSSPSAGVEESSPENSGPPSLPLSASRQWLRDLSRASLDSLSLKDWVATFEGEEISEDRGLR